LQNLLDKKKDVFVNKEYVGPFNHRTAPQQYGGNKRQGYQAGDSCQEISVEKGIQVSAQSSPVAGQAGHRAEEISHLYSGERVLLART